MKAALKHRVPFFLKSGFRVLCAGTLAIVLGSAGTVFPDEPIRVTPVSYDRTPAYGSFAPARGRWYGRATPVRTEDDATRLLEAYYSPRGLSIQSIVERPAYFEARISRGSLLVDRVIVFKRTGRIRSVY